MTRNSTAVRALLGLLLATLPAGVLGCSGSGGLTPARHDQRAATSGTAQAPRPGHAGRPTPPGSSLAEPEALTSEADPDSDASQQATGATVGATVGRDLLLPVAQLGLSLPAGRSLVQVALPTERFVTVGVLGPPDALLGFDVLPTGIGEAIQSHGALDEDGLLPAFVSFRTGSHPAPLAVVIETTAPVRLARIAADPTTAATAPSPRDLRLGKAAPRPLIGLPLPLDPGDGYVPQAPLRYQFLRVDVAVTLRWAMRRTQRHFPGGPIAIGDLTQWNGGRPGADRAASRHISHAGGRDVDIGLPANDEEPSTFRRHCRGVLTRPDVHQCAPGTVRGLDAAQLTYLLGLLFGGPDPNRRGGQRAPAFTPVEKVYVDQAYIDEIRKASRQLHQQHMIDDDAYTALGGEGVLTPSPWHLDHVHIRFVGEPARPPSW